MDLAINGFVLPIAQLGPNFLILREPTEHEPSAAEVYLSIDGTVERLSVYLPDGIAAGDLTTRIEAVNCKERGL